MVHLDQPIATSISQTWASTTFRFDTCCRVDRAPGHEAEHTKLETLCCLSWGPIPQHSVSLRIVTLLLLFVLTCVISIRMDEFFCWATQLMIDGVLDA